MKKFIPLFLFSLLVVKAVCLENSDATVGFRQSQEFFELSKGTFTYQNLDLGVTGKGKYSIIGDKMKFSFDGEIEVSRFSRIQSIMMTSKDHNSITYKNLTLVDVVKGMIEAATKGEEKEAIARQAEKEPPVIKGVIEAASKAEEKEAIARQAEKEPPEAGPTNIIFTHKSDIKHFYRQNEKEGELLIITGKAFNNYPAPRSFIRLRVSLLGGSGNSLTDRFVYAGNLISDEDLITLPADELMARMNVKSGQNNQNMNIAPGQEIPFMAVFHKVPPNISEYRVFAISSSPAE